ncbi:permease [Ralstonia pseudosolanacearum]|nr:hypothetical protein [Ralstonia pseudosolanacearum]MDN3369645.1 permease [Ralstonia pseudosolanacearum]OAK92634.1 permease [Ralstonia pseudosolanacearum]
MMRLLAMKPGHDGNLAYIANGQLEFSFEAEKDSGNRYAPIGATELIEAMRHTSEIPEAIVISGWSAGVDPLGRPIGAGYMGLDGFVVEGVLFSREQGGSNPMVMVSV